MGAQAVTVAEPERDLLSSEIRIALAPDKTFRARVAVDEHVSVWRVLRRPLVVALVIGVAVPIMAVQRVTVGLLIASTISFSFIVAIQMAVGAALIATAPSRRIPMVRALDLWFAGHAPYSAWLLTVAAVFAALPFASLDGLIVLAALPAAWTALIVAAFCRNVLGTGRAGARWRAAAHFLVIWAIGLELVALSAGGWFQITHAIGWS
jgi:hypothetical protein